jgi:tetratricopeptide (TPR) repeat protein
VRVVDPDPLKENRNPVNRIFGGAAFLLGLLLFIPFNTGLNAQNRIGSPRDTIRMAPTPIDTAGLRSGELVPNRRARLRVFTPGLRPEVAEAERLLSEERYQDAIDLLTSIWESDTSSAPDQSVASALKRAHRALKDYPGVFAVLRKQLKASPGDPVLLAELADIYFAVDAADSAATVLRHLISAAPDDPLRYQLVAESYMRAGKTNEGLGIYRDGRAKLGDSAIFAEQLARILEARREYAAAIDEYFRWLTAQPEVSPAVQRQITSLIKIPEAAPQITAALRRIVIASPGNEYAHALYGDLLAESGQIDSAFAEYRRADRLAKHPGIHRLSGIGRCFETQHFQEARDESVAFLRDYPDHPDAIRVHMVRARAELALGRSLAAVELLKELAAQIPRLPERAHIEYEIGEIYREHTDRQDSAQTYFRRVVDQSGRIPERAAALLRLGDIEVYFGDLALADSTYRRAAEENPTQPLQEEIAFRQAELMFLTGAYDDCAARLKTLVKQFPRGFFVNDALELSVILKENKDAMNWSLNRYAAGLLALRQHQIDSALARFGELASDSANSLADEAVFQEGLLYAAAGRLREAVEAFHLLIQRYPAGFLVPRAWVQLGDLYSGPLADPAKARAAYQVVITDFRDSPLVEEARRQLQALPAP